jgi:carbon monoxide dehydrogenase subunit G
LAISFSGDFTSPRSPDEVYDFLSDPNKFAPLLPDFESMSVQDATHFTVKVRVGVGNIRGSAEIKMELAEASRPQRALYRGQGTAVGSQVKISAGFDLSPIPDGTRIAWQGEAGVFGKLASMAGGMLEPLGKKNIQKLIDGLQWALTWPPAQTVAATPSESVQGALAEQQLHLAQPMPSEIWQHTPASQSNEELANGGVRGATSERASSGTTLDPHRDAPKSAPTDSPAKFATGEIPNADSSNASDQTAAPEQTPARRAEQE